MTAQKAVCLIKSGGGNRSCEARQPAQNSAKVLNPAELSPEDEENPSDVDHVRSGFSERFFIGNGRSIKNGKVIVYI